MTYSNSLLTKISDKPEHPTHPNHASDRILNTRVHYIHICVCVYRYLQMSMCPWRRVHESMFQSQRKHNCRFLKKPLLSIFILNLKDTS